MAADRNLDGEHRDVVIGPPTYLAVYAALLLLFGVTLVIARIDLGALNLPVALTIAGVKAGLVGLYFMHLRYSSKVTGLFAAAGLVWLGIMLAWTFADYVSRGWALH